MYFSLVGFGDPQLNLNCALIFSGHKVFPAFSCHNASQRTLHPHEFNPNPVVKCSCLEESQRLKFPLPGDVKFHIHSGLPPS